MPPQTDVYTYIHNHTTSAYKTSLKKFPKFRIKPKKDNQKRKLQKFIQACINLIYNSI